MSSSGTDGPLLSLPDQPGQGGEQDSLGGTGLAARATTLVRFQGGDAGVLSGLTRWRRSGPQSCGWIGKSHGPGGPPPRMKGLRLTAG